MKEQLKISGVLDIIHTTADGQETKYHFKNLVVDTGKAQIAQRMVGTAVAAPSHLAVGTGSTAPAAGNTTLVAQVARVALGSANASTNQSIYSATFGAGVGTGLLAEAGLFNDPTAGTMTCRSLFPSAINKQAGDILTVTWTLTFN